MGKKEETSEKLEVLVVFEIIALIHFPHGFDSCNQHPVHAQTLNVPCPSASVMPPIYHIESR